MQLALNVRYMILAFIDKLPDATEREALAALAASLENEIFAGEEDIAKFLVDKILRIPLSPSTRRDLAHSIKLDVPSFRLPIMDAEEHQLDHQQHFLSNALPPTIVEEENDAEETVDDLFVEINLQSMQSVCAFFDTTHLCANNPDQKVTVEALANVFQTVHSKEGTCSVKWLAESCGGEATSAHMLIVDLCNAVASYSVREWTSLSQSVVDAFADNSFSGDMIEKSLKNVPVIGADESTIKHHVEQRAKYASYVKSLTDDILCTYPVLEDKGVEVGAPSLLPDSIMSRLHTEVSRIIAESPALQTLPAEIAASLEVQRNAREERVIQRTITSLRAFAALLNGDADFQAVVRKSALPNFEKLTNYVVALELLGFWKMLVNQEASAIIAILRKTMASFHQLSKEWVFLPALRRHVPQTFPSPKFPTDLSFLYQAVVARIKEGVTSVKRCREYRPFPVVQHKDSVGTFVFDPLFRQMSVVVRRQSNADLPKRWSPAVGKDIPLVVQLQPQTGRGSGSSHTSMKDLLAIVGSLEPSISLRALETDLVKQDITSISTLKALDDKEWERLTSILSIGRAKVLRVALAKCAEANTSRVPNPHAEVHWIRLLVRHEALTYGLPNVPKELRALPWLSTDAIEQALHFASTKFHGYQLLQKVIADFYLPFTTPRSEDVDRVMDTDRGVLLFGPPGTGKSRINELLPEPAGIVLVAEPMSSGELARPYVGQTEKAIGDYCRRAKLAPYLLFGWVVDETDSMAPKRSSGTGSGGPDQNASKLAAFLSVVGGSSDVKNVVILGATNRLESMDEAVLRRLSAQFYVGKPNFDTRRMFLVKDLMKALHASGCANVTSKLTTDCIDAVVHATVNFSGAAMKKLGMRLFLEISSDKSPFSTGKSDDERKSALLDVVRNVCRQMRITLSRLETPVLMAGGVRNTRGEMRQILSSAKMLTAATRRILIDSRDKIALRQIPLLFEITDDKGKYKTVSIRLRPACGRCKRHTALPEKCTPNGDCDWFVEYAKWDEKLKERLLLSASAHRQPAGGGGVLLLGGATEDLPDIAVSPDVVSELLMFADNLQLTSVILLDRLYLQEKGCYDEAKALEELQSIFNERTKAPSLVILDLDSIGGLSLSQSTGFSGSLSYNIQQPGLLNACLAEFSRGRCCTENNWIVAIVSSDVTRKWFDDVSSFPLTESETKKKQTDSEMKSCTACGIRFCEKDNKPEACKYHPGTMFMIVDGIHYPKIGPLEEGFDNDPAAIGIEDQEEPRRVDDTEEGDAAQPVAKKNIYYSCCGQRPGSSGCHSKKHDTNKFERRRMKFSPSDASDPSNMVHRISLDGCTIRVTGAFMQRLRKRSPNMLLKDGVVLPKGFSRHHWDKYVAPFSNGESVFPADSTTRIARRVAQRVGMTELANLLHPLPLAWDMHQSSADFAYTEAHPGHIAAVNPSQAVTETFVLVMLPPGDVGWSCEIRTTGGPVNVSVELCKTGDLLALPKSSSGRPTSISSVMSNGAKISISSTLQGQVILRLPNRSTDEELPFHGFRETLVLTAKSTAAFTIGLYER